MAKRLTVQEKTRREVKAWLGLHGFYNFACAKYDVFKENELNDIIIDAVKEGMNKKWEAHIEQMEWENG
jgi:hypothetical protein